MDQIQTQNKTGNQQIDNNTSGPNSSRARRSSPPQPNKSTSGESLEAAQEFDRKQASKSPQTMDLPISLVASSSQSPLNQKVTSSTLGQGTSIKLLEVTRHRSTIEMPTSERNGSLESRASMQPRRKTSVFSHNGFTNIHKLDQAAIQQHPITAVAKCSIDAKEAQVDGSKQVESKSQQQPPNNTSPMRPTRSDTLGSTGSSRASSCDEPTILSPNKLLPQALWQSQQKQATSTNLIPKNSSNDFMNELVTDKPPNATLMSCSDETELLRKKSTNGRVDMTHNVVKVKVENDEEQADEEEGEEEEDEDEEDDDDDEHDAVFVEQGGYKSNKEPRIPPPFESIKAQLKNNPIPNAQDIKRHIENLISRNEQITGDWNQISIRSYNTSSQTAASTSAGPSSGKRPSKRWSTTSMGKMNTTTLGRKFSYNQPTRRSAQIQPQLPAMQQAPISDIQCNVDSFLKPPSMHRFTKSMPTSPNRQAEGADFPTHGLSGCGDLGPVHSSHTSSIQFSDNHQQTIENAIRNLSIKKRDDELIQRHHQYLNKPMNSFENSDNIMMATILLERQRQQRLLEEYLLSCGPSSDTQQFHLMNHFHLEQQMATRRLTAIDEEYKRQQQLAVNLSSTAFQQQHQMLSSNKQLMQQFNSLNTDQTLANQLLNDYIANVMLKRGEIYNVLPNESASRETNNQHIQQQQHLSATSPSRVYLSHGTEMLTQSLDSATPSHRCEACDISFWTRDLLNYHKMTSCSAREGPGPSKPVAFNFGQPNGFDSTPSCQELQITITDESNLPIKKRKISEPNMRALNL